MEEGSVHLKVKLVVEDSKDKSQGLVLPSKVSKTTQKNSKGTALGVYSTSQFIGIFIGGLAGGFFYQQFGLISVHLFCLFITFLWLLLMLFFSKNENLGKNELEEEAV